MAISEKFALEGVGLYSILSPVLREDNVVSFLWNCEQLNGANFKAEAFRSFMTSCLRNSFSFEEVYRQVDEFLCQNNLHVYRDDIKELLRDLFIGIDGWDGKKVDVRNVIGKFFELREEAFVDSLSFSSEKTRKSFFKLWNRFIRSLEKLGETSSFSVLKNWWRSFVRGFRMEVSLSDDLNKDRVLGDFDVFLRQGYEFLVGEVIDDDEVDEEDSVVKGLEEEVGELALRGIGDGWAEGLGDIVILDVFGDDYVVDTKVISAAVVDGVIGVYDDADVDVVDEGRGEDVEIVWEDKLEELGISSEVIRELLRLRGAYNSGAESIVVGGIYCAIRTVWFDLGYFTRNQEVQEECELKLFRSRNLYSKPSYKLKKEEIRVFFEKFQKSLTSFEKIFKEFDFE